jgi:hypothetical protein
VLSIFYAITFMFSLKNIANVQMISYIIFVLKFVVVMIYFSGGLYAIYTYDSFQVESLQHFDELLLPKLVGNVVFTFMIHHSMPGIVYPIHNEFET